MLSSILNALNGQDHGIRKFSLILGSRPPNTSCAYKWDCISPLLQNSLISTFSSPQLKYLQVESISDLPLNWIQNSQLKHLHLTDIWFDVTSFEALSQNCLQTLECLQMTTADSIKGIPMAALASLNILSSIVLTKEQLAMTWEVMKTAESSLEDLSIHFFGTFLTWGERFLLLIFFLQEIPPPATQEFDFTKLTNLKCFNLTYTLSDDNGSSAIIFHPNLSNIHGYLNFGAPLSSLDSVELLINSWIDGLNGDITVPQVDELSEWHLLDNLLTSNKFPSLRNVDLTYSIAVLVGDDGAFNEAGFKEEINKFFATALPMLHASKSISFTLATFIACLKWDEVGVEL